PDPDAPVAAIGTIGRPVLAALRLVAADIGMSVATPGGEDGLAEPDDEGAILKASGLRGRQVLLRDDWWRHENGPLLARWEDGKAPVALLWRGRGYVLVDPADGRTRRVDPGTASALSPLALMVYPRLPSDGIGARTLVAMLGHGIRRDAQRLALLSLLAAALGLGVPVATGLLVDEVIPAAARDQLTILVGGLVAAALCAAALELGKGMLVRRIEGRADSVIQAAFFDRLLRLPPRFFKAYTAGDMADRVLGVQAVRQLLSGSAAVSLLTGVFSLANLALLFAYDARLALVAVGVAVAASVPSVVWGMLQLRHERDLARNRGRVEGFVFQLVAAVGKLKVAAALDRAMATWAERYAVQRARFVAAQRLANTQAVFQAALSPLGMVVLFLTVSWLLKHDLTQQMTAAQAGGEAAAEAKVLATGDFLAFNAAFGQFLAGMTLLCKTATMVLAVFPMVERIRPLVETAPEDDSRRHTPGELKGAIELSRVNFAYGPGMPQVLNGVSFRIKPGEFVAIVGPSGSGKSTIMRLLLGIETPDDGEIFFDGKPMSTLNPTALRSRLGVVLQHGRVLPGTVLDNIQGGTQCRLEDAWEVARMVGLEADIQAMPMAMRTVLQEGGGTLSGGQRQRLLIARALVRKPRILLLDEATSALDNQTQAIVTETLRGLGITRVVIAHRLSTIEKVNRVLVLDQGRLVQDGALAELRDSPGLLSDFIRRQSL
ncbi:MAG: NHLP bacteriocin export ABC transporter permease/ATPase subunit, partial [Alphaproteobacteria bacterium]|nr:NHLP bacteriocin export ABC transporter permease/ATPase subunit [Alphaproteobacteria bacterium]